MCGIAGIVCRPPAPVDRDLLEAMTERLRHRGPDAGGVFLRGPVGLGHRRLSIIDTSEAANQPMLDEEGRTALVYNGEIYNFRELRSELAAAGRSFRTRSDTEVLLRGWQEYGEKVVEKLRGMFAFALYDADREQLFLARDRLGKKPLYYAEHPAGFAFASEIKALTLLPGLSREIDVRALGEYVAYGHSLGERSIYRGVRRLPPAHQMIVSTAPAGPPPRVERYWRLRADPDEAPDEEEWLERVDAALAEAVRLRLVSDVPLGALLSGGIDSSLVVAHMVRQAREPVRSFTIGFEEASHDESAQARAVARHLGTEHRVEVVTPDAVGILDELVDTWDEPFADPSAIPSWYLSRATRRHVVVALSGDGGDESFLGYRRYSHWRWLGAAGALLGRPGRAWLDRGARRLALGNRLRRPLRRMARTGFEHYHHALGFSEENLALLHPALRPELPDEAEAKPARDHRECGAPTPLAALGHTDLLNYLPDDVLVKVDRASMRHSLEVRCPLLDQRVVELAARIPPRFKLRGLTGKRLLRRLLRRHLPAELVERPKRGFGVPLAAWFRGPLAPALDEMLADEGPVWRYLDRQAVAALVRAHRFGRADLHASLWRVLFFQRWSRRHLG